MRGLILRRLLAGLLLCEGVARDDRKAASRLAVAELLDLPATGLRFGMTPGGKPLLTCPEGAGFSRSHSHGVLLVGAARGVAVGVDLERLRPGLPLLDIADSFFDAGEAALLRAQPQGVQPRAFYTMWACKEAVLKADGLGIAKGLQPAQLAGLDWAPLWAGSGPVETQAGNARLTVLHLDLQDGGYVAALATIGAP